MSQEEVGRMFIPGPRKSAQRTNSSSSISSLSSNSSTISASSATTNGSANTAESWDSRKKPGARALWPPGKSQPTSGLSTARPQSVSTASSGASAASGLSALHTPLLPSQQMANGQTQQNVAVRNQVPPEGSAFLYLLPMNGTFERKTIHVPYYPDVLRIGRQTNAKTAPTPANGYFDSKVLSRQHAEIYAERNGRIFIRDVKSSNGTFVNGKRLSPENKESEPHELREQDVLELGIDIVSEDQKTVVHHKVAARVEHAGIYSQSGEIGLGELDPTNAGFMGNQPRQRPMGHQGVPGMKPVGAMGAQGPGVRDQGSFSQQQWSRMWLQPISTEHIVKRLNRELNLARQQSQDIDRARSTLDSMLEGKPEPEVLNEKKAAEKSASESPHKSKISMNGFPEPPAPPPSQPLPEKPDISRALNDPAIQPLLMRSDTARPPNLEGDHGDQTRALFVLTHELKAAKDQIPNLEDRVKLLEQQLREERTARVNAEERAYQLEHGPRKDSAEPTMADSMTEIKPVEPSNDDHLVLSDLQAQLERLQANMADMKTTMESYRRRAELAEGERDEARQTLAEMVEEKRTRLENELTVKRGRTASRDRDARLVKEEGGEEKEELLNGHTIRPSHRAMALTTLLEKAGLDGEGRVVTKQQAVCLQRVLKRELGGEEEKRREEWAYHGIPHAAAVTTVIVGLVVMRWLNGWEKAAR
ncbi:hypothetical protein K461DRAFT_295625 [Myriangium duriaei CBS 260.36]|uniref:FHA domain-containing protein n=1 Tax=Myriangium duriaei CBS 260.36 TaxID=1168546 RepID=A0A9P4IXE7_9PEZI|nr:hypothetical protein K461DRAFT_295625 [Myriangium duriaei CBS 260.36]